MERNRLLITGITVAVFFTAVLALGLVFFYPRQTVNPSAGDMSRIQFDPNGMIEGLEDVGVSGSLPENAGAIQYDDGQIALEDDGEMQGQEISDDGITIVYGSSSTQSPNVSRTNDDLAMEYVPAPEGNQTGRSVQTRPQNTATERNQAAPAASTQSRNTETASRAASSTRASVSRQPAARAEREFWVQVFAGSSRSRAAQAVERFVEEAAMHPIVTTVDAGDAIMYRLRVGPYSSRGEAEALLASLNENTSFGDSYISVVYN
jgi:DedD protein